MRVLRTFCHTTMDDLNHKRMRNRSNPMWDVEHYKLAAAVTIYVYARMVKINYRFFMLRLLIFLFSFIFFRAVLNFRELRFRCRHCIRKSLFLKYPALCYNSKLNSSQLQRCLLKSTPHLKPQPLSVFSDLLTIENIPCVQLSLLHNC